MKDFTIRSWSRQGITIVITRLCSISSVFLRTQGTIDAEKGEETSCIIESEKLMFNESKSA